MTTIWNKIHEAILAGTANQDDQLDDQEEVTLARRLREYRVNDSEGEPASDGHFGWSLPTPTGE